MHVLVLNCGSSSIKAEVLDPATGSRARVAKVERIQTAECSWRLDDGSDRPLSGASHADALAVVLPALIEGVAVSAVGHRVVHGGEEFTAPTRLDDGVVARLEGLSPLAPLHNPSQLGGIAAARALLPDKTHVAVFDTAFHATLPRRARVYALPNAVAERHGIRRYGFHGTSHAWVAQQAAAYLGEDVKALRIITCHLGSGASIAAVEYGRSIETSMGMTPLEGLVMRTRSGDVDPGALLALMRGEGLDVDGLDRLLNRDAGLAGLSGTSGDMRDLQTRAAEGDDAARLAIGVFTHRLRKYIGAYAAVMGGVDAIVFTAGIGENSGLIRHRVAQRLDFLGARLSEDANRDARVSREAPCVLISDANCRVKLLVVATDEERAIATEAARVANEADRVNKSQVIPIAVSARHIHLTDDAVEALFGKGHKLTPQKPLSQPGQYACEERLAVVGPKSRIEGVRVLGPPRSKCQVEISRTDEFALGVDAPVRNSGDVANSPGVTLEGPAGTLTLKEGLICARRHIHMTPGDAERFGVKHGDVVEVALDTNGRDLIFGDVLIRVSRKYQLEMHLDTDEANAADLMPGTEGALVDTGGHARLVRRSTRFD